jgi:ribosomal protein L37E
MTEIAAFTNRPECLACGDQAFHWRFIPAGFHMEHAGGMRCAAEGDHLDLTCQRCGWQFSMRTRDNDEG